MFPTGDAPLAPEDERILNRELLRLDMAISAAEKLAQGQKPIVVMLHYPPLLLTVLDTPFTQVLARHRGQESARGSTASMKASIIG